MESVLIGGPRGVPHRKIVSIGIAAICSLLRLPENENFASVVAEAQNERHLCPIGSTCGFWDQSGTQEGSIIKLW